MSYPAFPFHLFFPTPLPHCHLIISAWNRETHRLLVAGCVWNSAAAGQKSLVTLRACLPGLYIHEKMIFHGELSAKHINISSFDLPQDIISHASLFTVFSIFPPLVFSYISSSFSNSIIYFPVFSSASSSPFPSPMGAHLLHCISHSLFFLRSSDNAASTVSA